jgi:serine/threonine protein kinase/tetratricopeptide (TPR) repeat protein
LSADACRLIIHELVPSPDNLPVTSPGLRVLDAKGTIVTPVFPAGDDGGRTLVTPSIPIDTGADRTVMTPVTAPHAVTPSRPSSLADGDAGPLAVGQAFGTRYLVIKVLGIGGMGAVYHVWDAELGQAVALKLIRPETISDPAAAREMERRFKQELVLARQVTHKNVVRIHDLGEINGIKYITMPYLDGSDLSTMLKKEGKLPVPAALRIVRDVAAGLQAAHEAGIVHRDLKPANIMLVGDQAIIMDFGIARATGQQPQAAAVPGRAQKSVSTVMVASEATMAGAVVGTVAYMAPEQAKGGHVDQRADLYALGLIFSDMVLGRRRMSDGSALDDLQRRIEQAPPPVRTVDPAISEAVETIISRCLEPDPAGRFQTSTELVAELDRLDENGEPIPIRRVVGLPLLAAVIALLLALSGGTWWYFQRLIPAAAHPPVTVLVADFQNGTKDPAFDRTVEPILKLALEGASFISAYDRTAISRNLGVAPPAQLDEVAARELAIKQGVNVVLTGSLSPQARGYGVSVKAVQAVTGEVIATASDRASSKEQVLGVVTNLAGRIRSALGDDMSESAKRFSMETLSTASLDVVRHYVTGMDALNNSHYDEALQSFSKAVELDPNFGVAYATMAITSRNMSRQQDAENYAKEAVRHVDRMTERERYRSRGLFYLVTGDYQACVKEYSDLIVRYPADPNAFNNLALCSTHLRTLDRSLDARRRAVAILPNLAVFRSNLAFDATYAGDFQTGEREARKAQELGSPSSGSVALALVQVSQGRLSQAAETLEKLAMTNAPAASRAASGLGEMAIYEGRLSDAVRIFERSAPADAVAKTGERAAEKFAGLAYAQLLRQQKSAALAAADNALRQSQSVKTRFLTARIFLEAGQIGKAQKAAASLASEIEAEPQALAKVIEAEVALKNNEPRQAIKTLTEATTMLDTWIGRFDLGRAYLEAGLLPQADSEFDRCFKRRGEALSFFLDDQPNFGYLPLLYYYRGRVWEELKTSGFADAYHTYLDIRGKAGEDPLLPEVRRRAGS